MKKAKKETRWIDADLPADRLCQLGAEFCIEGELALGMSIWVNGVDKEGVGPAYCSGLGNYCFNNGFFLTATQCYAGAASETHLPEDMFRLAKACLYARKYDEAMKIFGVFSERVSAAAQYSSFAERLKQDDSGFKVPPRSFDWDLDRYVDEMDRVFGNALKGGRFAKRDIMRLAEIGYLPAREMDKGHEDSDTAVLPFERYYGHAVTDEALLGRGFWLLEEGEIGRRRAGLPNVKDLTAKRSYSKFRLDDSYYPNAKNWVKAMPVEDEVAQRRRVGLLRVITSPQGEITKVNLDLKTFQGNPCGFGGFIVDFPGMDDDDGQEGYVDPMQEEYDDCAAFDREMKMLFAGRYLKPKETMIGKKLPASFRESTYAAQSAVAKAYWHVSVDEEDGTIKGLDFSTYHSTGSAEADMFSRPQLVDDHLEDANAAILHIIDKYTDEEWREYFK